MMDGVNVRRAASTDLREILSVARLTAGAPAWSEAVWAKVLSADGGGAVFVAELGDRVVGFVVLGHAGEVAEIESLAVAYEARRQGIGARLCAEGLEWAREVDATQIELEVRASNEAARRLYAALGFREQGIRRGYYNEPTEDAVLMGLLLKEGTG